MKIPNASHKSIRSYIFVLFVLLGLTACGGIFEVGIERTATPGVALATENAGPSLPITPTPADPNELLKATVSLLATQNAHLATRVGAQTTRIPVATPTATFTPTPSPVPPESLGYPPNARTGIPVVDAIIDAVLADDLDAMRELVHYTTTGCTFELGMGGPPKCEAGEKEGTLVEVFPILGSEGGHVRREDIDTVSFFSGRSKTLYAVYRVPADAYEENYWPAGEYGIIFLESDRPSAAMTFLADDDGIVRMIYHYSFARLLELEYGVKVDEFILPPLATLTPTPTPYLSPTETPILPPLAPIPSEFWEAVGVSPGTLVAVQTRPDTEPFQFGDIATMHVDGTDLVQLTTYRYNAAPVLSPDRQRIAYRSVPSSITSLADPGSRLYEGHYNIWVITVDGAQAWQLTNSVVQRGVPVWSPDSRRVAFSEGPDGLLVEVELDTGARHELTQEASAPRYRPDGGGIGYITAEGSLAWIDTVGMMYTIVSASNLPNNTSVKGFDWLPDGGHVVYTLADETERIEGTTIGIKYSVWIAQADGSNPLKLADDVRDVRVAPDGRAIAALQGSGYGDACFVDQQLVFLLLAPDLTSARLVGTDGFEGYPQTGPDQSFYPVSEVGRITLGNVTWVSDRLALGNFSLTCTLEHSTAGRYLIDPIGGRMVQITRADSIP